MSRSQFNTGDLWPLFKQFMRPNSVCGSSASQGRLWSTQKLRAAAAAATTTAAAHHGCHLVAARGGPRLHTCPNESLTISGSACSQIPKVNFSLFCLSVSLFGDPKRIVWGGHYLFSTIVFVRGRERLVQSRVRADNDTLLASSPLLFSCPSCACSFSSADSFPSQTFSTESSI